MEVIDKPALSARRSGVRSFATIGAIGFSIEAVILTALTSFAGIEAWKARVPSFLIAVLTTWTLNRRHTFAGRGLDRPSVEAAGYVAIQLCGAAVNLLIFMACLAVAPVLRRIPVIPLGIGAVGGFACNFILSKTLLYSRARTPNS